MLLPGAVHASGVHAAVAPCLRWNLHAPGEDGGAAPGELGPASGVAVRSPYIALLRGVTSMLMPFMNGESSDEWVGCALLDAKPPPAMVLSGEKSSSSQGGVISQSSCFRFDFFEGRDGELVLTASLGRQTSLVSPTDWGNVAPGGTPVPCGAKGIETPDDGPASAP